MPSGRKRGTNYKEKVKKLSLGLFHSLTDLCLFSFFFSVQGYSMGKGKKGIVEAIDQAIQATKSINAYSLERVLYRLTHKSYLAKKEDFFKITDLGRKRLLKILPQYDQKRPWDGIIYLVTYDIPENKRRDRDVLRQYLDQLGCGLLQKSVWLTPYNPKKLIIDFVKQRNLAGLVLVSELRRGSAIGGRDMLGALEKVYDLDKLNKEYKNFIKEGEERKLVGYSLIMNYLSILNKDPQIPFELEPEGFLGRKANYLYTKEVKKLQKQKKSNNDFFI